MIKVLIADDHTLMREGLRDLLARYEDLSVVGEAKDGEEAIQMAIEQAPDVVLMDVEMPRVDGIEATRRILAAKPDTRVLVLTVHSEGEYVDLLTKAGAKGYLLKSMSGAHLVEAIRLISSGAMIFDSKAGEGLVSRTPDYPKTRSQRSHKKGLSDTDIQVLGWVSQGMTNAMIAKAMGVSDRTVKSRITRIFGTLGVRSRAEAITAAIRLKLIEPSEL